MIALGIRYLTGYAVATNIASRQRPEWPPHPGRVFMAMAAAHFETGAASAERSALEWLEDAPVPALRASDAAERSAVRTYVPVNDHPGAVLPRPRQERAFPCARPHEDSVYLLWSRPPAPEIRAALEKLCGKVTRIGHSSSAVQMWVVPEGQEPAPNWLPGGELQELRLRVPRNGTLHNLESAFNGQAIQAYEDLAEAVENARGKPKTLLKKEMAARFPEGRPPSSHPRLVDWQGYGRPAADEPAELPLEGPFDEDFIVLAKREGIVLGLEATLQLTGALRNAAMKAAGDAPPEWLSGHAENGQPSRDPHVAFFPLPYVGFEHADAHLLGLALAIPRALRSSPELRRYLGPLFFDTRTGEERLLHLWNKDIWRWELERETRERPPVSLQRATWTRPSRKWASVTPVVLHHHPKKRAGDLERILRESFRSALIPEPERIDVRSVSEVQGAGHALALPPFREGGANLCRFQTHVTVYFPKPVRGPLLVGRGRYRGYGLLRPVTEDQA